MANGNATFILHFGGNFSLSLKLFQNIFSVKINYYICKSISIRFIGWPNFIKIAIDKPNVTPINILSLSPREVHKADSKIYLEAKSTKKS